MIISVISLILSIISIVLVLALIMAVLVYKKASRLRTTKKEMGNFIVYSIGLALWLCGLYLLIPLMIAYSFTTTVYVVTEDCGKVDYHKNILLTSLQISKNDVSYVFSGDNIIDNRTDKNLKIIKHYYGGAKKWNPYQNDTITIFRHTKYRGSVPDYWFKAAPNVITERYHAATKTQIVVAD